MILNKMDLVTENQLEETENMLAELNPFATVTRSTYCEIPEQESCIENLSETLAEKAKEKNAQFESCGRPEIGVGVLKSSRSIAKDKLEYLIDIYSKKTIRIKGFAKLENGEGLAVQTSYEHIAFENVLNYHGSTELIAMGEGFNLSEFSRNYRELAS